MSTGSGPPQQAATTSHTKQRPPLSVNTQNTAKKDNTTKQLPKSGKLARRQVWSELDKFGYDDPDLKESRASAPWAPPEAFTPVGLDNAFTPVSMKTPESYFPIANTGSIDAALKGLSIKDPSEIPNHSLASPNESRKRPAGLGRLSTAPALLADRPLKVALPRRHETGAFGSGDGALAPVEEYARRATLAAPEILHPQPLSPARASRTSVSGSSLKQSTTVAFNKSIGAVKALASKATKAGRRASTDALSSIRNSSNKIPPKGRFPAYQEPPSLAERALNQGGFARLASDFADMQGRDIANLSPDSCEHLYKATSSHTAHDERQRAEIGFAARQAVNFTAEAQAQAALTRREIENDRAAAAAETQRRHRSHGMYTFEEVLGEQRKSREERARTWVAEEKDSAERMALENPDRYPGLRRH